MCNGQLLSYQLHLCSQSRYISYQLISRYVHFTHSSFTALTLFASLHTLATFHHWCWPGAKRVQYPPLPYYGWPTFPSVLWCCWLGLLTCKTVSRITYTVLVETLNPAQSSLTLFAALNSTRSPLHTCSAGNGQCSPTTVLHRCIHVLCKLLSRYLFFYALMRQCTARFRWISVIFASLQYSCLLSYL